MIKYGYLVFSILEVATIIVGLILLICLTVIIVQQGHFLSFLVIYPRMIELAIVIFLSFILVGMYILMHYNETFTENELKKCCSNI